MISFPNVSVNTGQVITTPTPSIFPTLLAQHPVTHDAFYDPLTFSTSTNSMAQPGIKERDKY